LSSLTSGPPSPSEALAEIRRIYFKTTARTIEHDIAHAIDLLKGLETEEAREKASVFMEGLAELRKEWQAARPAQHSKPGARKKKPGTPQKGPAKAGKRR
jgi:hypothetical protein